MNGRLVSENEDCTGHADLEVKAGRDDLMDSTNAEGRYAFTVEVRRKTKVEVFFPGNDCAPDLAKQIIRLR